MIWVFSVTGNANYFHYTKQGGSPVIDGVDDAKEMANTRQACTLLGNYKTQLCPKSDILASVSYIVPVYFLCTPSCLKTFGTEILLLH